jgi:hypothetical protein
VPDYRVQGQALNRTGSAWWLTIHERMWGRLHSGSIRRSCESGQWGWRLRPFGIRWAASGLAEDRREFDLHPEALRTWVKRAEVHGAGTTSEAARRVAQLERRTENLKAPMRFCGQ